MKNGYLHKAIFVIIIPIGLIIVLFFYAPLVSGHEKPDNPSSTFKQRGAHVFGIMDSTDLRPLIQNNIEWVTLVAWGFQDDYLSQRVNHHNGDSVIIRKSDSSWVKRIKWVRNSGFKVFVKPHVWIMDASNGKWRSDIFPTGEMARESWKLSYRDYFLRYARIAEEAEAEMFCIGAEFSRLSVEKPMFWKELIQEVRGIYSGKLTYAANWYKEFEDITFWEELDFIGVQAYFPLSDSDNPDIHQISAGWENYLPSLESIHNKFNRKIIFTEMGYKSTANSATKPWEWIEDVIDRGGKYSAGTQANCYQAFFDTVWEKEWFAGVHLWSMRLGDSRDETKNNLDFTPQGKPAENVIINGFEKDSLTGL